MWCVKCNKPLSECECPDLRERLEKLKQCEHLHIIKPALDEYEKQADKNKAKLN